MKHYSNYAGDTMTPNTTTQTLAQIAQGATYGGGFAGALSWFTQNSSALTAIAVIVTAMASVYFGHENKKSMRMNANANERRNSINDRDITDSFFLKLERAGKSREYIQDLKRVLRK